MYRSFLEMEEYLATETARHIERLGMSGMTPDSSPYPIKGTKRQKQTWLIHNVEYTNDLLCKMRNVGRKSIAEFYRTLDLETKTVLIRM